MNRWNVCAALRRPKDEQKFEPKWCRDGRFLRVVRVYWNLVISAHEVSGQEYRAGS